MENFCEVGKFEHKNGYDVCRDIKRMGELRYDFTLFPANTTATSNTTDRTSRTELTRTHGHYHTDGASELFEVVSGEALFFMQKREGAKDIISEAYLITASEGDKIVILPDFSVTSINASQEKKLLISNWVSDNIKNDYGAFEKLDGNCYKIFANGVVEKNPHYKQMPNLIRLRPKKLPSELENLDFLNNPQKYAEFLTIDSLYERM